ncbi:MAG: hypothetical protein L6V95_12485 [Candidatus Melainabacteria bacterium]|nr:MAG: hypothetical protein L6V95_12485 [Candidatus Melainabacteria bacterium]
MYYIGSDNDIGKDSNGNIATTNMSLTVSNVATHLSIMTELYKNSRVNEEGQKVVGDEERIAEQKAINSIQTMLSGLIDGENVENTKGKTGAAFATAGIAAGVGVTAVGVGALIGGIGKGSTIGAGASGVTAVAAPIVGAVAGGAIGYGIANEIVKNDTAGDFINQDGSFRETKATSFKHTAMFGGGIAGGLLGAAGTAALVGEFVGWLIGGALLAAGATVGICALIKKYA